MSPALLAPPSTTNFVRIEGDIPSPKPNVSSPSPPLSVTVCTVVKSPRVKVSLAPLPFTTIEVMPALGMASTLLTSGMPSRLTSGMSAMLMSGMSAISRNRPPVLAGESPVIVSKLSASATTRSPPSSLITKPLLRPFGWMSSTVRTLPVRVTRTVPTTAWPETTKSKGFLPVSLLAMLIVAER